MARTIIQKLRLINATIEKELSDAKLAALDNPAISTESPLAERLSTLAIQAIMGGSRSEAWKAYMKEILGSDNEDSPQFKRLTFQDDQATRDYVIVSNAYIVSNAVCGSHTITNTLANVATEGENIIDKGLDPEP